jgi:hypothetical protein
MLHGNENVTSLLVTAREMRARGARLRPSSPRDPGPTSAIALLHVSSFPLETIIALIRDPPAVVRDDVWAMTGPGWSWWSPRRSSGCMDYTKILETASIRGGSRRRCTRSRTTRRRSFLPAQACFVRGGPGLLGGAGRRVHLGCCLALIAWGILSSCGLPLRPFLYHHGFRRGIRTRGITTPAAACPWSPGRRDHDQAEKIDQADDAAHPGDSRRERLQQLPREQRSAAAMTRPMLKQKPEPVARIRVGRARAGRAAASRRTRR